MPGMPNAQIHALRLLPGADLRTELESTFRQLQTARGIQAACVISAVGSLSQSVLRYAAQDSGTVQREPLELMTLSGTLGPDGMHLHASVADARGQVTGGHLMAGCLVRTTAEVVLALLPGWVFGREPDTATGYAELVPREL